MTRNMLVKVGSRERKKEDIRKESVCSPTTNFVQKYFENNCGGEGCVCEIASNQQKPTDASLHND